MMPSNSFSCFDSCCKHTMTGTYKQRRRNLGDVVFEEYRAQWINYRRYYLASDKLGKWGRWIQYAITVLSALLLAVIGAAATYTTPTWLSPLTLLISALTASFAITGSVANWPVKSNQYYNSGQQHQELYKEFNYFVKVRLPDENECINELEYDAIRLIIKKNDLNEATPQLHTKWFKMLRKQRNTQWEQPTLEELRDGSYDFD